jgi:hypothetical protein
MDRDAEDLLQPTPVVLMVPTPSIAIELPSGLTTPATMPSPAANTG